MKSFLTERLRLEVAGALADNPDLIISSSSNDEVNAMMMCDAVLNTVKPGQPVNRSQVRPDERASSIEPPAGPGTEQKGGGGGGGIPAAALRGRLPMRLPRPEIHARSRRSRGQQREAFVR